MGRAGIADTATLAPMRAEVLADRGTGPALVYVPGIDGTGELLLGTAARLEANFRLIRLRYVADTDHGDPKIYGALADSIASSLAAIGVDRALLLAESFGGGLALHFALRHPERTRGLALVNTFARFPHRIRVRLGAWSLPIVPRWALRQSRSRLASALYFWPRRDAAAEAAFQEVPGGFRAPGYYDRMRAVVALNLEPRLSEVQVPCALFAATHDRVVPSLRTMGTLAAGLPDATLERLERANHVVLPLGAEPWPRRLLELDARARAAEGRRGGPGQD